MVKKLLTALVVIVSLGTAGVVCAQDFDKGMSAYDAGDYATALKEWTVLAERGVAEAQHNLGRMYNNGQGVTQDYKKAVKWYRKSVEQGFAMAQSNLGMMYSKGHGVVQDNKEAVKWFHKAAAQGRAKAQSNLGVMYGNGQGVIQDNVYAHMWFNIAASNGNTDAVKYRDSMAKRMTAADISKAQELARACVAKKYKGC